MMRVRFLSFILLQFVAGLTFTPAPLGCAVHYLEESTFPSGKSHTTEVKGMWKSILSYVAVTHIYDTFNSRIPNSTEIRRSDIRHGDKCSVYSNDCTEQEVACSIIGTILYMPDTTPFDYDTSTPTPCPNHANGCTRFNNGENYIIADQKNRTVVEHYSLSSGIYIYSFTYFDDDPPSLNDFGSTTCKLTAPTVDICSLSYSSFPSSETQRVYSTQLGCSFEAICIVIVFVFVVLAVILVMLVVRQTQMRRLDSI